MNFTDWLFVGVFVSGGVVVGTYFVTGYRTRFLIPVLRSWFIVGLTLLSLTLLGLVTIFMFESNIGFNLFFDLLYARTYSPFNPMSHFSSEFAILSVGWFIIIRERFKGVPLIFVTILSLTFIHEVCYNLSYSLAAGIFRPYFDWSLASKLDLVAYSGLLCLLLLKGKKWEKRTVVYSAALLIPYYAVIGFWLNIPTTIGPNFTLIAPTALVPNLVEVAGWISISVIGLVSYLKYHE